MLSGGQPRRMTTTLISNAQGHENHFDGRRRNPMRELADGPL